MSKLEIPEGFILVSLERHEAIQTDARTFWKLPPTAKLVYSTKTYGKTHWYEYYLVPELATLERIRISNRGNIRRDTFPALTYKVSKAEEELLSAVLEREERAIKRAKWEAEDEDYYRAKGGEAKA